MAGRSGSSESGNRAIAQTSMIPAFDPANYPVEVTHRLTGGAMLFEAHVAEMPDVVVYGTTEEAVLLDMYRKLSRWHAVAFPDAKHKRWKGWMWWK